MSQRMRILDVCSLQLRHISGLLVHVAALPLHVSEGAWITSTNGGHWILRGIERQALREGERAALFLVGIGEWPTGYLWVRRRSIREDSLHVGRRRLPRGVLALIERVRAT